MSQPPPPTTPGSVLLVGEPGIGKSRLVLEFARALEERPSSSPGVRAAASPTATRSASLRSREIVKAHAGILDSDDVATVEAKLEAVLPEGDDRPWLRQRLRPLLGLEASPASQEESFAAWTLFLTQLASPGPVVLVFEDLHWAGEGMLAFVEQLAAQKLERPAARRGHDAARSCCSDTRSFSPIAMTPQRLTFAPLTRRDAGRLVSALLDERVASEVRAPDPRTCRRQPALRRGVRAPAARPRPAAQDAAASFGSRRARTLPLARHRPGRARRAPRHAAAATHKAVLCDAAVFGESFSAGGVAALAGGRTSDDVAAVMAALAERQLVRPAASSSLAGEAEYLFWHALARDVAYAQLAAPGAHAQARGSGPLDRGSGR